MLRWLAFSSCRRSPLVVLPRTKLQPARPFSISTPSKDIKYIGFGESNQPKGSQGGKSFFSWHIRTQIAVIIAGAGAVYYISHLEQVPETGRWRFMNTSPESETTFGEYLRRETLRELENAILPPDHVLSQHVRRVVTRILHASNLGRIRGEDKPTSPSPFGLGLDSDGNVWNPDADVGAARNPGAAYGPTKEWDVVVVENMEMVNAMANPGIIIIFTGILPVCQDEEGLAAVLAHEIGHIVARHGAENMSANTILIGVVEVLQLLGLDYFLSDMASRLVIALPKSRKQDLEADLIGLRLMSRACYDPKASLEMLARLAKVEQRLPGGILFQTHVSSESRVKFLKERLAEGYSILDSNPGCAGFRRQFEDFKRSAREVKFENYRFGL